MAGRTKMETPTSLRERSVSSHEFHQRSWWIVHTQPIKQQLLKVGGNPTNSVGGLFISDLHRHLTDLTKRSEVGYEPSNRLRSVGFPKPAGDSISRPRINNPPTALVEF